MLKIFLIPACPTVIPCFNIIGNLVKTVLATSQVLACTCRECNSTVVEYFFLIKSENMLIILFKLLVSTCCYTYCTTFIFHFYRGNPEMSTNLLMQTVCEWNTNIIGATSDWERGMNKKNIIKYFNWLELTNIYIWFFRLCPER